MEPCVEERVLPSPQHFWIVREAQITRGSLETFSSLFVLYGWDRRPVGSFLTIGYDNHTGCALQTT
jgi:hypothetical protein